MTTLTTTTELEAVNVMLGTIQEAPVNSLGGSVSLDVSRAQTILAEVSRATQKNGWHFNTLEDYPLNYDNDGFIDLPANTLQVTFDRAWDVTPVQRGTRVYDKKNRTFVFTRNLTATVVQYLAFTDLPEAARYYVTIRAARLFQQRTIGSQTLDGFTQEDEFKALMDLKEAEGENAKFSLLDNYDIALGTQRRRLNVWS